MADSTETIHEDTNYRPYNPYERYSNLYVHAQNAYQLPVVPEYLFHEESLISHRNPFENFQFYTGTGYLSGAFLGAIKGTFDGLRQAERGDTLKLRINRVLNTGGHMGRRFGNSLGIVGLIFGGLESGLQYYRGSDDLMNTVVAGLGTGAIYRAAGGLRSAAIAGVVGGIMAGAAVSGKQVMKRYVLI